MTDTNDYPPSAGEAGGETIDLHRLIAVFRRRLKLFAAVAALVFLIVAMFTLSETPKYTATANLQINTRTQEVVDSKAVLSGLTPETSVVDTEVEALKSPELAAAVVDELRLIEDPEFNGRLQTPGLVETVKGWFGLAPDRSAPTTEAGREAERQRVINGVGQRLSARRVGLTYSMNLSFTSESPVKASRIANLLADKYLESQLNRKLDATGQANTFLGSRLNELRQQMQLADAAVSNYRIANNLLSSEGFTLTEQEISAYNQQLASVRAQEAEQVARLRTARAQLASGSNGDDVGEALTSQVVQNLRAQRAAISARVADMSSRYGPLHPDMVRSQRELADIDAQIQAEIRRIISNLEAQVRVAQERTGSVQSSLSAARGALASNSGASVQLRELEGNAEAARAVYQSFLDRYRQTSAQVGTEQADATLVSRASIPTSQSAPNVMLNLALSLVLGLGAGLAAVVLLEMMEAGVGTTDEIERKLGLPSIGSIPLVSSIAESADRGISPIDFAVKKPLSVFAESFRSLRTSINYAAGSQASKLVVITSALPGEGKTTTAVGLAQVSAIAGSRVLLLDCDLRRRAVTRAMGLNTDAGLVELLQGTTTLEAVLKRDEASGAYILPLSNVVATQDVFGTQAMDDLLAKLRGSFDLILMDTAPVLALADTRILAAKADMTILLVRWRKTPARATNAAVKMLQQSGAYILGAAMTQVDVNAQAKQGYGDAGYYYSEYKKYYSA
ncbi:GumC family protein [Brevundimonas sp. SL130]|uniref:GumC family protein n=1 Tax=Brevundimonas sp. SL130 TaxID=2995143 RepID=UPI00226CB8F5|nr:polysaccharide biosynthesis tyrosine autokinase [Brevundimonas sp. SL130]WAC59172.1 polysaccharide biosynthesis tyrosine autokinase [Brevundimonas sp. SL130]